MFQRQPHLPEVMNACPMADTFEVGDPEEDIDSRVLAMKVVNEQVSAVMKIGCLISHNCKLHSDLIYCQTQVP